MDRELVDAGAEGRTVIATYPTVNATLSAAQNYDGGGLANALFFLTLFMIGICVIFILGGPSE